MKRENPEIVEFIIDEAEGDTVDVVSLDDVPAIEVYFLKFNKDKEKFLFNTQNEEKRIVVGPALIPLKYIYRYDVFSDREFYGFFSEATVEKAMEIFMRDGKTRESNLNHNSKFFKGLTVIESWKVVDENNDKAYALGYTKDDIPKGTWMITFKVDDEKIWGDIKKGVYRGFSIESFLSQMVKMRREFYTENMINEMFSDDKTDNEKFIELYNFLMKLND